MAPPLYLIEIPFYGNSDIRLLKEDEHAAMGEMDLERFEFWRHDGSGRFWALKVAMETIRSHHLQPSDYADCGNGIYEEYESGFEHADALIKEHGSFLYFLAVHSWGTNGHRVLPPTSDLRPILPFYFGNLIASKGLLALSVTSDVTDFLRGYVDYANGLGGDEVMDKALEMGLIQPR